MQPLKLESLISRVT